MILYKQDALHFWGIENLPLSQDSPSQSSTNEINDSQKIDSATQPTINSLTYKLIEASLTFRNFIPKNIKDLYRKLKSPEEELEPEPDPDPNRKNLYLYSIQALIIGIEFYYQINKLYFMFKTNNNNNNNNNNIYFFFQNSSLDYISSLLYSSSRIPKPTQNYFFGFSVVDSDRYSRGCPC